MKAIVCRQFGPLENLEFSELPSRPLAPNEVRVALEYAAVNLADELMVRGEYQLKPPLPFSPGSNGAGVVKETGTAVTQVRVGDRVSAGFFYGTYAEELVTDEDKVTLVPSCVTSEQAAALRIAHGTALFALQTRAQMRAGDIVLVTGAAGGVGLAAVEIARMLGATVIACAGSATKGEVARRYGAHHVIDYARENVKQRVLEISDGRGADIILDVLGGELFRTLLGSMSFGGRLLVVGFASGVIPAIPANIVLLKNVSVCGVFFGAWSGANPRAATELHGRILDWCQEGKLDPHISRVFPLASAVEAMRFVGSRQATGRVLLAI
ncbi:MAG: NADPH:quinone oxidoreductase family protein [Burkholderiaceae bacterium]|nr:NADPH:quinone oxidoreductase family protein [Burkholderiaceae bacterium]